MAEQHSEQDGGVNRRNFVAATGLGVVGASYAAAFGYPIYRYLADPAARAAELAAITEVALPKADLPGPGSVLMFRFGTRPTMLIHHEDGTKACFDAVCTHLGCTVEFQPDRERIYCPCHAGVYDMRTGRNVGGPPPRPLGTYAVEETDAHIVITRI